MRERSISSAPSATAWEKEWPPPRTDAVLARLRTHGAELIGEVVQYEDTHRLC